MGGSWAGKEEEISLAKDAKGAKKLMRCFELLRDLGEREIIRKRREGAPPERTYFDRIYRIDRIGISKFHRKREGWGEVGQARKDRHLSRRTRRAQRSGYDVLSCLAGLARRKKGRGAAPPEGEGWTGLTGLSGFVGPNHDPHLVNPVNPV
jgi:hypothetical protein